MRNKNIHTFIGCEREYHDADTVIFGAPYDGTTSYRPGARFAPSRMRSESYGMETYSPYQEQDLLDKHVFDGGDLDLPFGDPKPVLSMIEGIVEQLLNDKKKPMMIGGEHLVTLGAVRAAQHFYPDLHILHFDAHADLRQEYLGQTLSHATVMRRCHDLLGDRHICQFGIRSGDKSEFAFAKEHTFCHTFDFDGLEATVASLAGRPVYLSLDLDVLDPSEFPGTGTPEAGGIRFTELIDALRLTQSLNIVAADINELSPPYDPSGVSTALACKVLRELLLMIS